MKKKSQGPLSILKIKIAQGHEIIQEEEITQDQETSDEGQGHENEDIDQGHITEEEDHGLEADGEGLGHGGEEKGLVPEIVVKCQDLVGKDIVQVHKVEDHITEHVVALLLMTEANLIARMEKGKQFDFTSYFHAHLVYVSLFIDNIVVLFICVSM